ncbi:LPXTG cell wall anchor domain-containing protein, partial [Streptomyces sp. SPB78]
GSGTGSSGGDTALIGGVASASVLLAGGVVVLRGRRQGAGA